MSFREQYGLVRSLLIYYGNPWRKRQMRELYARFIRPGDLCFDVGAHVGNRTAVWAAMGAKVVAVEPQPYLMTFLRRQFGAQDQITLVEQALGAGPGTAVLHASTFNPTVATLSTSWIEAVRHDEDFARVRWDKEVAVRVTTLDELIATHGRPAFCKIDVEGYESAVLAGLSTPLAALSFEFIAAAPELAEACLARLEALATYEYNWSPGEKHRLQKQAWLPAEALRAELRGPLRAARSGDIYARLAKTAPPQAMAG